MYLARVFPEEIELIIFSYLSSNDILNYLRVMGGSKSAELLELYHLKMMETIPPSSVIKTGSMRIELNSNQKLYFYRCGHGEIVGINDSKFGSNECSRCIRKRCISCNKMIDCTHKYVTILHSWYRNGTVYCDRCGKSIPYDYRRCESCDRVTCTDLYCIRNG